MKEIIEFDKLPYDRKIMFTTKDYHVKSQILWGGICIKGDIPNDGVLQIMGNSWAEDTDICFDNFRIPGW